MSETEDLLNDFVEEPHNLLVALPEVFLSLFLHVVMDTVSSHRKRMLNNRGETELYLHIEVLKPLNPDFTIIIIIIVFKNVFGVSYLSVQ